MYFIQVYIRHENKDLDCTSKNTFIEFGHSLSRNSENRSKLIKYNICTVWSNLTFF